MPPGVRVDPSDSNSSRNPSATATEVSSSLLSEEIVEVKDFTSSGGDFTETPSSVVQESRSPGTVLSEVTYDDERKATPKSRGWLWSPVGTGARGAARTGKDASLHSSDEFRLDTGLGHSSSNLAQYRRRQKRRRRRRRRRAVALVLALLLLIACAFTWKGAVIVPMVNEMSRGRLADFVLPLIDTDTALKYKLTRLPKKREKETAGKKTNAKTGTATRASSGASAARKPHELLKEFQINKLKLTVGSIRRQDF